MTILKMTKNVNVAIKLFMFSVIRFKFKNNKNVSSFTNDILNT